MRRFTGLVIRVGRLLVCGLALAALLGAAGRAAAQQGLKDEMTAAAKKLATAVGNRQVTVGSFTGPKNLQATGGPGIAKALSDALKKQKVTVQNNAALTVDGDFADTTDPDSGRLGVRLNIRLKDRSGVRLEFARDVFPKDDKDTSITDILGKTGQLPANADARDDVLRKDPKAFINGTRVAASDKSVYAVEVLVKSGNTFVAKRPESKSGRAFVSLKRGDTYAVRLINTSNFDAAVTLSIDGLNIFSFSEEKDAAGDPKVTRLIVPKQSQATIKGWYLTSTKTASFEVTDPEKSAGGTFKSPDSVGTITASFAVAVAKGSPLPSDEPKSRAADATGQGAEVGLNYKSSERTFGAIREVVSVRYAK